MTIDDAIALHRAGRVQEAIVLYQACLAEKEDDFNLHRFLGLALKAVGDFKGAARHLSRAAEIWPEMHVPWLELAELPADAHPAPLYQLLINAALRAGTDAEVLTDIARKLHELRATPVVLTLTEKALALNPEGPVELLARSLRVMSLLPHNRFDDMVAELPYLLEQPGTDPVVLCAAAIALNRQARFEAAEAVLREVLRRFPDYHTARYQLGARLSLSGRQEEAVACVTGLSVDALLDVIDRVIGEACPVAGSVVYNLRSLRHLGHLSLEPHMLRAMYPGRRLVLLTEQQEGGGDVRHTAHDGRASQLCNREVWQLWLDRCVHVTNSDPVLTEMGHVTLGVFERGGRTYFLDNSYKLFRRSQDGGINQRLVAGVTLNDDQRARGRRLQQQLGIDSGAKIIVLHVRELGYHPSYRSRCADPLTYIPVIRYFLSQGYVVIRIGDPTMTPLGDLGSGFFDMPFRGDYDPLIDPYFIEKCAFFVTTNSGPSELARAFGRPLMVVNAVMCGTMTPLSFELLAFKKIREIASGRLLSYADCLAQDFTDINEIESCPMRGFDVEALSSDELLAIGQEMLALVERHGESLKDLAIGRGYAPTPAQRRFHDLSVAEDQRRRANPGPYVYLLDDWLGLCSPRYVLSDAYARLNPTYIAEA